MFANQASVISSDLEIRAWHQGPKKKKPVKANKGSGVEFINYQYIAFALGVTTVSIELVD